LFSNPLLAHDVLTGQESIEEDIEEEGSGSELDEDSELCGYKVRRLGSYISYWLGLTSEKT